ncbi:hypothetical protein PsYK624_134380 [Phanerochaete sordida]|uniref:Uncharacterized protein n=1 Tax=Phanerochaete sordida TaxID=48140 RepID=A0A9P3LJC0_9APHY|nr:hypothetical protein PsYK624_134380 [Phanerochaete sordida]
MVHPDLIVQKDDPSDILRTLVQMETVHCRHISSFVHRRSQRKQLLISPVIHVLFCQSPSSRSNQAQSTAPVPNPRHVIWRHRSHSSLGFFNCVALFSTTQPAGSVIRYLSPSTVFFAPLSSRRTAQRRRCDSHSHGTRIN